MSDLKHHFILQNEVYLKSNNNDFGANKAIESVL